MPVDPVQLDQLFTEAIAQTAPDARAAFLDQACAENPELRERLVHLLVAHDAAGSFLKLPDEEATTPFVPLSERPGTIIGPYKLLQQIGEGGMGVVFMAEQTRPLQRMVALKIIKPGMDTRQVIARFESERQALAMMDHPNIAKVLDAGATDTGRPYFVMELVKGVPITQFCDDKQLPLRARLELLLPVCQAVQHAHQKGVIHRDIKPSNVLVANYDDQPIPKVIDFGVAKATASKLTEKTMFTEFGQIVGTLEYMSPEQATFNQLDIDTRSDIYSLGVLLYELLAGSTPFERKRLHAAAFDEVLRIIREEEPPKPSTRLSSSDTLPSIAANRHTEPARLSNDVRGELDWIVMRALEKDRNRRYETANGLAADVQRYLNDETVLACPPSAAYRFQKFARRNKPVLLTTGFIAATLILGAVVSTWQAVRASRAKAEALARANEARQSEAQTQAVLDFVQNKLFAAARPEGEEGGLGHDVTLRQAIEAALPFVETSFREQPLVEGQLRCTLGLSFLYLGEADEALEQFQKSQKIFNEHLGPEHPNTLRIMNNVGGCYSDLGRYAEALELREKTLELQKAKLGADHSDTLRSMLNLASTYSSLGRYDDAVKLAEEALALEKGNLGIDQRNSLRLKVVLANSYDDLGRHSEALQLYEEVLTREKAELGPDHPETLSSMSNLALSYSRESRYAEALDLQKETLALQKAKLGPDHPDTLTGMYDLAAIYSDKGEHTEALQLFEEALALEKDVHSFDHPNTLKSMLGKANCYSNLGRYAEALNLYEETLALQKVKLGSDHPDTLNCMTNLAVTYSDLGRHDDAIKLEEELLALAKVKLGPDHPDTLLTRGNLAISYSTLSRYDEALKLSEETLALQKAKLGPEHAATIQTRDDMVSSFCNRGGGHAVAERWNEATADFSRAVKLSPQDEQALPRLAVALLKADREAEYRQHCQAWLARMADVENFASADKAAKSALLLPVDGVDFTRACELADFAATAAEPSNLMPWMQLGEALAEYRREQFDSAIAWADRCIVDKQVLPECAAAAWFIHAAADARLERQEAAQVAFGKGDKLVKKPRTNVELTWHDWAIAELIRAEAEELLEQKSASADGKPLKSAATE